MPALLEAFIWPSVPPHNGGLRDGVGAELRGTTGDADEIEQVHDDVRKETVKRTFWRAWRGSAPRVEELTERALVPFGHAVRDPLLVSTTSEFARRRIGSRHRVNRVASRILARACRSQLVFLVSDQVVHVPVRTGRNSRASVR
jgi:hypothetical protein